MPARLFTAILFILLSHCFCAQGLVLNGGFEDVNVCTEYKVECAPEAWISSDAGFNNYFRDANRAHAGWYCLALEAGNSRKAFRRTYIRTQLVCRLRPGAEYIIRFYIKSPHPVLDSTGIYFSAGDPLLQKMQLEKLVPHIWVADAVNTFPADSSWLQVQMKYKATGDEVFLLIGNFSRRDITGSTGIERESHFFVFIDNVTMQPANAQEELCADWQQRHDDLYEQNERHEFLQRSLRYQRSNPRQVTLNPTIVPVTDTLLMPDVLFESGKKDLHPQSFALLDSFCRSLLDKKVDSLVIEGHTDDTGGDEINEPLSLARSQAAAAYLRSCGRLFRVPVVVRGRGSRKPVTDNRTPAGRQQNRRVELILYFKGP